MHLHPHRCPGKDCPNAVYSCQRPTDRSPVWLRCDACIEAEPDLIVPD